MARILSVSTPGAPTTGAGPSRPSPVLVRSAVAVLLVFLGVGAMSGAQAAIRVSGSVENEAGEPVPGAEVVLTPVDDQAQPTGAPVSRIETNKKGKYVFGFAAPGNYLVSVKSGDLQLVSVSIRMRDGERKPVYSPDGVIEDRTGPVDPANPVMFIGIPRDAFYVEADLVVGKPKAPAAAAGPGSIEQDILDSGLGKEVESILASLEARQYEAALNETNTLIAANPDLAPLHYVKGFALVKLGQLAEAEAPLREALRLDPKIGGAAGLLGQILGQQGKYEEAAVALRQELDRATQPAARAPLLLSLGQALLETGKTDEAIKALEESLQLDPENPDTKVQLTDAYVKAGRNADAEKLMGADMDPQAAAILHYNVAANMLRAQKWEQAAEHLRQALALKPDLVECHRYLGEALLALGKTDEAIAEFEAYLKAAPNADDASQTRSLIDALTKNRPSK